MAYVIGLDLGTTRCKAVAVTPNGDLLGSTSVTYPLSSPYPGWTEQSPNEIWIGALKCLKELVAKLPEAQPLGISLSGAMHSLFPLDEHGAPLAPAMTWADQRASAKVQALQQKIDPAALQERTGCPLQASYFPARLRWWLEEKHQTFQAAAYFTGIKDWVLAQLCGRLVTDLGMASTSGLLNIHNLTWDAQALELAGISAEKLPELVSPQAVTGSLLKEIARQTGLPEGLPVVAGTSDGGLANLGAGAIHPGQSVITVGTSAAVRRIISAPRADRSGRTWCYVLLEDRWFRGGAINNAGLAVQWVHERFFRETSFETLFDEAARIPVGSQGVFFLPYLTGERSPYWNPQARGLLSGLRLETERAQIARAALEGVAFCLADVWQVVEDGAIAGEPMRLTGSITNDPTWMQIMADVLGLPLAPFRVADASAMGAAIMGLAALEAIPGLDALVDRLQPDSLIEPDPGAHSQYLELHQQFQDLYKRTLAIS